MVTYWEHSTGKLSNFITALSRFPASKVGSSLLSIIQSAMEGVVIADAARQIVLVNRKAERMFGYPARQLLESSLDILIPPRIDGEQRRYMDRLTAIRVHGRRSKLELKGVHFNGERLSLNASISRIMVHGELFLVLILQDPESPHQILNRSKQCPTKQCPARLSELRKRAVSSQQANEAEKRRFSKKLYDDIGQRLSVLKLDLDWLENSLSNTNEVLPARVAQMQGLLDNIIAMTKNMASTLRPPLLDDFGLLPAVDWMAENFQKKTSITCTVENNGLMPKLADPIESAIFRVIQESLSNIERHAHASNAHITLAHTNNQLDVIIQDDGVGLASDSESKPGCYGLIAMQERVCVLGGTISIRNTEPQGVVIHVSVPVEPMFYSEPIPQSPMKRL